MLLPRSYLFRCIAVEVLRAFSTWGEPMHRLLLLVLLFAAPCAFAQSNFAALRGTVYDPQHNPVAGSEVQLTSAATHAVRRAVSNEQGIFEVTALWPGEYELAVQSTGFAPLTQTLRLEVNQQLALDLNLKLASASSTLQVVASLLDVLHTTDASVGEVIEPAAVEAMVMRAEAELGPVTILVNNAGVAWQGTLDTYDRQQVARMREVNVDGVIHATRAVMAGMRARRYGRIVNVGSIAAIGTALPGNAFYAAVKAEVLALTRRFALELGPHGITVNAVAPGFVRTDMTQRGRGAADWPGTEERLAARAMMGRIGEAGDIANAVVFLASPESGWITAQTLTVDGGRMDYIGHG